MQNKKNKYYEIVICFISKKLNFLIGQVICVVK